MENDIISVSGTIRLNYSEEEIERTFGPDPRKFKCECGNQATGSYGSLIDSSFIGYTCEFCYDHVKQFRPGFFCWTEKYIDEQINLVENRYKDHPFKNKAISGYKDRVEKIGDQDYVIHGILKHD